MYRITANLSVCEAYANCVVAAPEYFDIDDEAGVVDVLEENVTADRRAYVENAVRSCPVSALSLTEVAQ